MPFFSVFTESQHDEAAIAGHMGGQLACLCGKGCGMIARTRYSNNKPQTLSVRRTCGWTETTYNNKDSS